MGRNFIIS